MLPSRLVKAVPIFCHQALRSPSFSLMEDHHKTVLYWSLGTTLNTITNP